VRPAGVGHNPPVPDEEPAPPEGDPVWEYGRTAGTEADLATVRAIYAAFAARDLEAVAVRIAPDAELFGGPTEQAAGAQEPYRGQDGLQRYFADVAAVWDDLVAYADDFRATPGSVVVFGRLVSTVGDEQVVRRIVWTWRLRDGLVVSLQVNDVT
jgi:ketosteroid isomerase-like protein